MRRCAMLLALVLAVGADGFGGRAFTATIWLAQTSTVTNCMMACNSQAATCQTGCIVPGSAPTGAATTTGNANVSTSCQLNCSTQQVACQTTCARTSPSQ